MNPAIYVGIFLPLLVLYLNRENRKRKALATVVKKRRSGKEKNHMNELAVRFVGKECVIYLYDGSQIMGTVKEITEHAALVDKKGSLEAVNLDFVTRIREHPKDKNGKKKSVVID